MRAIDWAALLLAIFEIPSLFFSQYRANSVRGSEAVAVAVLAYLLVRFFVRSSVHAAWMAAVIGFVGCGLSFLGLREFLTESNRLKVFGFTDILSFRSRLIHPIPGWLPGEVFTLLLLTLAFASGAAAYFCRRRHAVPMRIAKTWFAVLPATLIAGTLFLSLSRAVFWSVVLFVFVACGLMVVHRVVPVRKGLLLLTAALGGLCVIFVSTGLLYSGVFRAYAGNHASQIRSTRGRLDIWSRSLNLVHARPLLGVGSSNAAFFLLSSANEEDTTGFASRPFSLPIGILLEKGAIGFAIYTAFLFLLGREFYYAMRSGPLSEVLEMLSGCRRIPRISKRNAELVRFDENESRKVMNCCFGAGIIVILFRELTYSSLLEHTLTIALFLVLAALVCRREDVVT